MASDGVRSLRLVAGGPETPQHLPEQQAKQAQAGSARQINKSQLVNRLNHINFHGGTILVDLRHAKYGHALRSPARPQPCSGDWLSCQWVDATGAALDPAAYQFNGLLVSDGRELLRVEPAEARLTRQGGEFLLPERCARIGVRQVRRHRCSDVGVQLIQNSAVFSGSLEDFSALAFRVELTAAPSQNFRWIDPAAPVHTILTQTDGVIFSGQCRIVRQTDGENRRNIVLEPLPTDARRYQAKAYPSPRQQLVPAPSVIFQHPLTGKRVELPVIDLSGSGLAVEQDLDHAKLMPGMVIPALDINVAHILRLRCQAQVVRVAPVGEGEARRLRFGLAILDMAPEEHVKLLSLLYQAEDRKAHICNQVDPDALWEFFFETGFIYPQKYSFIEARKEDFKRTYEKLYTQSPAIARHLIYQDQGRIFGHMGVLRFYEKSWLVHHHAANKLASKRAGLTVLDHVGRFMNESHPIRSLNMDYAICYFRPENKFPRRVFGGVAKSIADPAGCTIDTFAYYHTPRRKRVSKALPEGWQLAPASPTDLTELDNFYAHVSGGLMTRALDLKPDYASLEGLVADYARHGFRRERELLSLTREGRLVAVVQVNRSDLGLNMSELTSTIKVIVIDGERLPKSVLTTVTDRLSVPFEQEQVPVLLYPLSYAKSRRIAYEKRYNLWVLNLDYLDAYFRFCDSLFGRL